MDDARIEVEVVRPERTSRFRDRHEREALSTQWGFPVVWQTQSHELAAFYGAGLAAATAANATGADDTAPDATLAGVLGLRIAASLAHVDSLIVTPERRRSGIGRALVGHAESLAKYYNCHKMTLEVPAHGVARRFFEACGYKLEAVLAQHTWKRDVAVLRKFIL